ncbi:AI-2E family transporter [Halorubrum sp. JWXQ-INN 858]|uniref:AI-2E family transporter n=1 Tax=Halorubrum sp. JWXQ-INN 858 TaxID=2690782 RepID=UPI001357C1FA|nr:AI-2E family transporter [Halorubrum sp. JWXQ-INN 858]MWV64245.1 AI-2E family transporter [Halorubrum sp. JWXQ-INN 858]
MAEQSWSSEGNALTVLAVVSTLLAALLVSTYLQYVLFAIVLAYVLEPVQRRLERRMSSMIAAITLIVASIFVVFVPLAYVLAIAVQQGLELLTALEEGDFSPEAIQDRLETVGYVVDLELLYATYREPIGAGLESLAVGALGVVGNLPNVLIGLTVTVFVLFALLRDGEQLLAWLRSVVPVTDRVQRDLLEELDSLMWASVVGNVAVAAIQAGLLGVGLLLVGMPGVVFLVVATFVLALLPLVGAFGVWVPVSSYLFVIGRPLAGGSFAVYGLLVSVSDVYLRPALISRSGTINVAIIVLGIFGGVVLFGAIGLFVGPVVLGGAKVVLDLFARERAEATTA